MEVKAGYRQTDVGILPSNWRVKTLRSMTSLLTNGFVGKATDFYVDSDDGVLYIQGYNVEENSFNMHGIKRVSKKFHTQHKKSCLQSGDLLTIQTGDIGTTTVVPDHLAGANCHALIISRFFKEIADPDYYCQYFNSDKTRTFFKEIETGTTMKHLNVGDMATMQLPVPSLPEQRAIATALSDVDALITSLDQLIAKKRDIKQAAMQELLIGKRRLPGFDSDWKTIRLGDVADIFKGKGLSKADLTPDGERQCILYGELFTTYKEKIIKIVSNTHREGNFIHSQSNDVLMPTSDVTPNGLATASCIRISGIILGGDILILRVPDRIINGEFLAYAIRMNRNQIMQLISGITVFHIYSKDMAQFTFVAPSIEEQTAIATVLSEMDTELATLEQKRDKTKDIKQGMMQELLTGRIRLV